MTRRVTLADFPGAPRGSWIFHDTWLIVGEEGWSSEEWMTRPGGVGMGLGAGRPIKYDDERHRKARERRRAA